MTHTTYIKFIPENKIFKFYDDSYSVNFNENDCTVYQIRVI